MIHKRGELYPKLEVFPVGPGVEVEAGEIQKSNRQFAPALLHVDLICHLKLVIGDFCSQ